MFTVQIQSEDCLETNVKGKHENANQNDRDTEIYYHFENKMSHFGVRFNQGYSFIFL